MKTNQQALYDALILYHELWRLQDRVVVSGTYAPSFATTLLTAVGLAYTDLVTAITTYNANPEK